MNYWIKYTDSKGLETFSLHFSDHSIALKKKSMN
jgi:hypothetical protein